MRMPWLAGGLLFCVFWGTPGHAQETNAPPDSSGAAKQAVPQRIRVGGNVQVAKMRHQVKPVYPPIAKTAKISGTVILHAVIGKDGTVSALQFVSGPPLLMKAAMDAVKQWVYEPTSLNGAAVEVDTTISVVFTLDGKAPEETKPIDPVLRADILKLFDATGLRQNAVIAGKAMSEAIRPVILKSLPDMPQREEIADAYMEKLFALVDSPQFVDRAVEVYAKYFTDEDVQALTEFYKTPAGQHLNATTPKLLPDMNKMGQQLAADNMNAIWTEMCKTYPQLKGKTTYCPADKENQSQRQAPAAAENTVISAQQQ
jgi:TonB family protein